MTETTESAEETEIPVDEQQPAEETKPEEPEIDIDHIPDSLHRFLMEQEVILDLIMDYDSASPRGLNRYGVENDIAWAIMYAADNGFLTLTPESLSAEEAERLYSLTGRNYMRKVDGASLEAMLKNQFGCSDDYIKLIQSGLYQQNADQPDSYIYDNGSYCYSFSLAGYAVSLGNIAFESVEKSDDCYRVVYSAEYESLFDPSYPPETKRREVFVRENAADDWSVVRSTLL